MSERRLKYLAKYEIQEIQETDEVEISLYIKTKVI